MACPRKPTRLQEELPEPWQERVRLVDDDSPPEAMMTQPNYSRQTPF